jgi:hypothetical protein
MWFSFLTDASWRIPNCSKPSIGRREDGPHNFVRFDSQGVGVTEGFKKSFGISGGGGFDPKALAVLRWGRLDREIAR